MTYGYQQEIPLGFHLIFSPMGCGTIRFEYVKAYGCAFPMATVTSPP
ncbi:hypothetical protein A33Q_0583 [Indibacter alkaliphilus LW1]|uniref:Uncharacterized protein n=1 Tax=Indibacter alkaliphilus (strain CCUG 57479 / KCTC 22604 / LW1) TaxID=1189612 RepID=S2E455_INDAL|nr:hypothetical protein A33Q_0583 [Indibacter alkaliphilus LW1]